MDRDTMVEEVRRRLGEDAADFWEDTDIIRALNAAQQKVAHESDWSWLQTFASTAYLAGADDISLPADIDTGRIVTVRLVSGGTSTKLNKVTPGDGFRLMNTYTTATRPRWYFTYTTAQAGGVLTTVARLVPEADVAGTVDFLYYRRPADLAAGNQEPDMPEDIQEALVCYAAAKLWLHELDASGVKAGEQMQLYADIIARGIREESKLGDDEQLAIGKMDDERERAGVGPFMLPDNYGWPTDAWGWDD